MASDVVSNAMKADWDNVASATSVIQRLPTLVDDAKRRGCESGKAGPLFLQLLRLLDGLKYKDGGKEVGIPSQRVGQSILGNSSTPISSLGSILIAFWRHICNDLRPTGDHSYREEIHRMYFPAARFSLLSLQLALKPSEEYHRDFFNRLDMLAEREHYAKYLKEPRIQYGNVGKQTLFRHFLDCDNWKEIQNLTAEVSMLKMGEEMRAELAKNFQFKQTESDIAKARKIVDGLGDTDPCAKIQLALLGILAKKKREGCEASQAKKMLLDACDQYAEAFISVSTIDELKGDERKFKCVQLAIWWARYFCTAIGILGAKVGDVSATAEAKEELRLEYKAARAPLLDYNILTSEAYNDSAPSDDYFTSWLYEKKA